ncbi:CLUMA_CG002077, isoform A [Clunio marinus]|uniref:CLUMA_CG002077, isoform A n=1 Tax=Clunio marinus TaxID=568069 RepID=A0A1J1HL84_9DIPT|nr:CLUMA_CG002077, isoform A [Clunio marinus]
MRFDAVWLITDISYIPQLIPLWYVIETPKLYWIKSQIIGLPVFFISLSLNTIDHLFNFYILLNFLNIIYQVNEEARMEVTNMEDLFNTVYLINQQFTQMAKLQCIEINEIEVSFWSISRFVSTQRTNKTWIDKTITEVHIYMHKHIILGYRLNHKCLLI